MFGHGIGGAESHARLRRLRRRVRQAESQGRQGSTYRDEIRKAQLQLLTTLFQL
jgi:hypothetical protein